MYGVRYGRFITEWEYSTLLPESQDSLERRPRALHRPATDNPAKMDLAGATHAALPALSTQRLQLDQCLAILRQIGMIQRFTQRNRFP